MPRPRRVSDEQIKSAARQVFQQVGVNAPVALVAKALGVTPAALFHRTGSKEQLFVMAMSDVSPRQFKLLQLMREGPDPEQPVEEQIIEILTRLSAHLAVVSPNVFLKFAAGLKPHPRPGGGLSGNTRRQLAAWLLRARPLAAWRFGNATILAEALVGSIEARHLYGFLHSKRTSVGRERRFVRALVAELLPRTVPVTGTAHSPEIVASDPTSGSAQTATPAGFPTIDADHR